MTKKISLSNGENTLVDDEDYDFLMQWKWRNTKGYAKTYYSKIGKDIPMHRLVANTPIGMLTDHVNGNKLDNRKCNLRICTPAQNCWNAKRKMNGKNIYKGIRKNKGEKKWLAAITKNGKYIHIGSFTTEIEAAKAYNKKAKELFGEFAKLNIIPEFAQKGE